MSMSRTSASLLTARDPLVDAVTAARASGTAVALAFVDVNDFRRVRDSLGSEMGEELLATVSTRLRSAVRPADHVDRRGQGFLVLLRDLPIDARLHAEAVGQRITDAMHAPFALGAAELLVEVSVGISIFPEDAETPESLRKHADAAMYEARAAGGGVHVYGVGTADPLERLELAARLRRAIERGELELHHQPILRLADEAVIGVESLVRWRDPARGGGLVPPAEFIPVAERTGVIDPLGDWVLREVCRQAREWGDAGLKPNVGFNVSPRQLRSPEVARRFAEIVSAHGIEPRRFVLEITESAWSLEASRLLPVLGQLRAAGFVLAIDDFGAGYSSLWRLRELPVQIIKVDRAFLAGVPEDPQGTAVYRAILNLADACGCDVVAEGVETAAHAAFLAAGGCRIAQGFHFGRPVPEPEMTAMLEARLAAERTSTAAG
jgi:diguanylate cyclase (GGDEF)-like protein